MATRKYAGIPPVKLHKGTGQAYVNLNGRRRYLGRFGTPEAERCYHRTLAEWEANSHRPLVSGEDLTLVELIDRFWTYASSFYTRRERDNFWPFPLNLIHGLD